MFFKDLNVGDVFKLIKGDAKFIKFSVVNDNEYPFRRYYNYPSNVLIIDKLHYGVISPMAEVYRIKEYHGQEQEKASLNKLLEKHKFDIHLQNFMTYGGVPMDVINYAKADCINTWRLYKEMGNTITKVIFNDPATIVIWGDGSKTVVKCQKEETFDPEKGLAMAISKKMLGNDYSYYETFAKYVGRYNKKRFNKALEEAKKIPPDEITYNGETYVLKK